MLNGDVLTDIDLTRPARARTRRRGARGHARARTRSRTRPPTASCASTARRRGDASSSRSRRPTRSTRNNISAGAYVLERSVLDLLEPGQPASIERDVFPRLVGDGLYGCVVGGLLARHRDARALPAGRRSTSSRAPSRTEVADAHGRRYRVRRGRASRTRAGSSRRRWSRAAAGSPTGARDRRPRRCSSAASPSARARRSSARSCMQGAEIGAQLHAARLHRRPAACGSATTAHVDGHERARRGRRRSAPATSSPTARASSPASTLPDGALQF